MPAAAEGCSRNAPKLQATKSVENGGRVMTENKMTESEIMKALEICSQNDTNKHYMMTYHGIPLHILFEATLALINRKNAENEELSYKLGCLLCTVTGNKMSKCTYDLKTMKSVANDFLNECCEEAEKEARAEAIKEFMQRANEKAFHDMNDGEAIVCCCDLDQIAKEMGVE
jgi:hypothetical protein